MSGLETMVLLLPVEEKLSFIESIFEVLITFFLESNIKWRKRY